MDENGTRIFTIFLDIDGVLNRRIDWDRPYTLNDRCISAFGRFCQRLGAVRIILTSSWRGGFLSRQNKRNSLPIRELEEKLAVYGITVIGKVSGNNVGRTQQILDFLEQHPQISPDFSFILDDNPEESDPGPPLDAYCTMDKKGFTDRDGEDIIRDLRRQKKL